MAKRLMVLLGMLAVTLAAAVPALAQEAPRYGEAQYAEVPATVTATGVLGRAAPHSPDPAPVYAITDEATGTPYELISGFVELEPFVGQRVTIEGGEVPGNPPPGAPLFLNVTSIAPADDTGAGTATHGFELAVEGHPPANATFFGLTGGAGEGAVYVQLTDADGDGLYTGSRTVTEIPSDPTPIAILQATGTEPCPEGGACPGDPITLLRDFGLVPLGGDQTFSASVSFDGGADNGNGGSVEGGDTNNANKGVEVVSDADGNESANASGGGAGQGGASPIASVLPATGGILPVAAAAGALLILGGLVARRIFR